MTSLSERTRLNGSGDVGRSGKSSSKIVNSGGIAETKQQKNREVGQKYAVATSPMKSLIPAKKPKGPTDQKLTGEEIKMLTEACQKKRPTGIPLLFTIDQLVKRCKKLSLKPTNLEPNYVKYLGRRLAREQSKKRGSKGKKGSKVPGRYVVKRIIDAGLSEEGREEYLVEWEGYEGQDTWEPVEHLDNCREMLMEYHKRLAERNQGQAMKHIVELSLALNRVLKEVDLVVLFKLSGKTPKDFSNVYNKQEVNAQLVKPIQDKAQLVLNYTIKKPEYISDSKLLEMTLNRLDIMNKFGSLEQFFEFCDKRSEVKAATKEWEKLLNREIAERNDGPLIEIENIIDNEMPPKFQYTHKYVPHNIIYDETPVVHCTCTDCSQAPMKKKVKGDPIDRCCIVECDRRPYNDNGTLMIEPQLPIYECNSDCKCGDECPYKVVQRGRKFRIGIFRTYNSRGWGIRALERIPKGKFIATYMGELITVDEAERRNPLARHEMTYLFDLDYNPDHEALFSIDAGAYGNLSRFINHSCDPNLGVSPTWISNMDLNLPTIAFFTLRTIAKYEELTFDYNTRNKQDDAKSEKSYQSDGDDDDDVEAKKDELNATGAKSPTTTTTTKYKLDCLCGAANCRKKYM